MPGALLMEEKAMALRALVVQSCPETARVVSESLAAAALEAVVIADGQLAVAAVDVCAPDVVLVDLTLPPLDGWCVLAAIGLLPQRPLVVVRVGDASEAERAIALGADAWVDDDIHVVEPGRLALTLAA